MDTEPAIKRSRYNLRSQQNDPNTLNVRYWTRSRARPLGGIEQLHQPKGANTGEIRKRKVRGKDVCELLDINAFCILNMFDGLNLIELATVADTCSHLRKLARYHFQSKYSHPNYEIVDFDQIKGPSVRITIPEAAKIFRNFGEYMRGLKVNTIVFTKAEGISHKILFLIKEYCTAMLQELHLKNFYVRAADTRDFYSLFKSLHQLSLCNTLTEEPNKWSMKMSLCQSLAFEEMEFLVVDDFLSRRFPALERLSFRLTYDLIQPKILEFIRRHPKLRHITIVDEEMATIDVLHAIGEMGLQLETFEFNGIRRMSPEVFHQAVKPFAAMKTLKSFTMNCFYNSVEGLLEDFVVNGVPLEHLHLKHAELNGNAILNLFKMNTIKSLTFQTMDSPHVDRLLWVASKMPSLRELQIKCYESISYESLCSLLIGNQRLSMLKIDALEMNINLEAFNGLVKILKRRPQPIKLNIEFFEPVMKLNIPQKTVEANEQWITIKECDPMYAGRLFDDYDTADEFEEDFEDDSFDDDDDDFDLSFDGEIGFDHLDILGNFNLDDYYESN